MPLPCGHSGRLELFLEAALRTIGADLELLGAITNKTPTGAYRGTGSPEAAFCVERTMDLIARDLALDPAEVRRRNFIPPDAFPYQSAAGLTYEGPDHPRPRWPDASRHAAP